MRARSVVLTVTAALVIVGGAGLALVLQPYPIPSTAAPAERAYLAHCAECHGADGRGTLRATLFLVRPGNLADARAMRSLTDDYLFTLIKHGGAPVGKPGMPAFGFHLSDEDIGGVIAHVRRLSR